MNFFCRVDPSTPAYKEPSFVVFYSMLLNLFSLFCFKCKEGKPKVSMFQTGTMVTVKQQCSKCTDAFTWRSQPFVLGRYPAGNVLLSFAVLMAGASISRILLVCRHMGLCVFSARTFFLHQRTFLFPVILHYWESYRASLVEKLKGMKDVVWAGDGRFDSMGHSAKYGVYTMLCTTIMKVVHFEVVQVRFQSTQAGFLLTTFFRVTKSGLQDSGVFYFTNCTTHNIDRNDSTVYI